MKYFLPARENVGFGQIVVLDGGRIIETGTHAELLALGGEYAKLFTIQAEGYR